MNQNEKLEQYLQELQKSNFLKDSKTEESFSYMITYFRKHSQGKKRNFRTASIIVIALSSSLPVIAAFGQKMSFGKYALDKDFALAVLSALIALVSAILNHFRWEVGWRGQTEALFALQNQKAEWDAAVAASRLGDDETKAINDVAEAYNRFRAKTFEIVHAEMGDFFKVTQLPSTPEKPKPH